LNARFRKIVERLDAERAAGMARRPLDLGKLTGRPAERIPRPLQGLITPERLMAAFGDPWINVDSGGLIGQRAIEQHVATSADLDESLRLSRAQLHRAGLYREPWVRRVGDLVALNVGSLHHHLAQHHERAVAVHLKALGVNVNATLFPPLKWPTPATETVPTFGPTPAKSKIKTPW
jgi:hypothetical protein